MELHNVDIPTFTTRGRQSILRASSHIRAYIQDCHKINFVKLWSVLR